MHEKADAEISLGCVHHGHVLTIANISFRGRWHANPTFRHTFPISLFYAPSPPQRPAPCLLTIVMGQSMLKTVNGFMLFLPMHTPIHGQWWSSSSTHTWCACEREGLELLVSFPRQRQARLTPPATNSGSTHIASNAVLGSCWPHHVAPDKGDTRHLEPRLPTSKLSEAYAPSTCAQRLHELVRMLACLRALLLSDLPLRLDMVCWWCVSGACCGAVGFSGLDLELLWQLLGNHPGVSACSEGQSQHRG